MSEQSVSRSADIVAEIAIKTNKASQILTSVFAEPTNQTESYLTFTL
jgi:hypothetical protein